MISMFQISVLTNSGGRDINEDSFGFADFADRSCYIVCDGLGGHGMGDVASRLVKDFFVESIKHGETSEDYLRMAFEGAQARLLDEQALAGAKNKMRTTAAVCVREGDLVTFGHIGDSRVYAFSDDGRYLRTHDHSMPEVLALSGQIDESEIRHHPDRNIVLKAMGSEWERPMYEIGTPISLDKCRAILLCSDGFWELITEAEMYSCLRSSADPDEWLSKMESIVLSNGTDKKMDNYTAIAIINK